MKLRRRKINKNRKTTRNNKKQQETTKIPSYMRRCGVCHEIKNPEGVRASSLTPQARSKHECSGIKCASFKECSYENGHKDELRKEKQEEKKKKQDDKSLEKDKAKEKKEGAKKRKKEIIDQLNTELLSGFKKPNSVETMESVYSILRSKLSPRTMVKERQEEEPDGAPTQDQLDDKHVDEEQEIKTLETKLAEKKKKWDESKEKEVRIGEWNIEDMKESDIPLVIRCLKRRFEEVKQ
jgi:hypothetical protein